MANITAILLCYCRRPQKTQQYAWWWSEVIRLTKNNSKKIEKNIEKQFHFGVFHSINSGTFCVNFSWGWNECNQTFRYAQENKLLHHTKQIRCDIFVSQCIFSHFVQYEPQKITSTEHKWTTSELNANIAENLWIYVSMCECVRIVLIDIYMFRCNFPSFPMNSDNWLLLLLLFCGFGYFFLALVGRSA